MNLKRGLWGAEPPRERRGKGEGDGGSGEHDQSTLYVCMKVE
jgi:hypothetical protein